MRILVLILLLPFGAGDLFLDDGERDGRRGNDLYDVGSYADAAEAFAGGLAALSGDADPHIRYGLQNNLGAALLKSGDADGARKAFDRALHEAAADADVARTAYNAGNAAFGAEDLEAALDYYRQSLLRRPDSREAKFNYEFVKRRLEQQEKNRQEQQQGGSGEQSDEREQQGPQEPGEQAQNREQKNGEQQEGGGEQQQDAPAQENGQEQQDQQATGPSEDRLSKAQADRILQALQNEEEQLLREVQRATSRPRQVEKDW